MADIGATVTVGTRVRTTAAFTPLGSATLTDPTLVKVLVREPDGTVTDYVYGTDVEVVKDGVGQYSLKHVCDAAGTWWFSWVAESPSAGISAVEELAVRATARVVVMTP